MELPQAGANADTAEGTGNPVDRRGRLCAADCLAQGVTAGFGLRQPVRSCFVAARLWFAECVISDCLDVPWRHGGLSCRDRFLLHLRIPMTRNRKCCWSCSFGELWRPTPTGRGDRVGRAAQWGGYIATAIGRAGMQGFSMTTSQMNLSMTTNSSGAGTE